MTTITVTRDDTGKLAGLGEKCRRAYERMKKQLKELQQGEVVIFDYRFPRNGKFHRLHFLMLNAIFDAQEQFAELKPLRYWLTVGAGDCDFYPGPNGRMVAIPRSINYDSMDDEDFKDHHNRVKAFLRSERCTSFLWPHLSPQQQSEMAESILMQFEDSPPEPSHRTINGEYQVIEGDGLLMVEGVQAQLEGPGCG